MDSYDFAVHGRVFIPINFKPQNGVILVPIDFKVDTGADISTISKTGLMMLGYDMEWIQKNAVVFKDSEKPTTAAGDKINAGYVKLPLINILGYEGKQWPFQVIMDENQDFRNLLGRDLLAGFNYEFNNDDDKFLIKMAKQFKPRYKFLDDQEINDVGVDVLLNAYN